MADSSVPPVVFTPTGAVFPTESEILAGVQADYNAAFGGRLNPSLSTPQGQLCSSTAAIIGDKNDQFAYLLNQIDPATASGFMQDAIGRIYFLTRLPATSTTVMVVCSGLVGVSIPVGAQVIDNSSNRYVCQEAGVIGVGGSVTLQFAAQATGPIECPVGAITTIYQTIPGWDSVTNTEPGAVGTDVETRADFEYRRRQSVALNGHGTIPSIYANVFNVPGVNDVYAIDNVKNVPVAFGTTNYVLVPKSIFVSVVGGDPQAIAEAIWRRKDVGADYNGNTSVTVYDTSGYDIPYPAYDVQFHRPTNTPILFAITIAAISGLPSNIVSLVRAAVVNAFRGGDGGQRARIGATIFAGRFYAPVTASAPNISILSLKIGVGTASGDSYTTGIDQYPTINSDNISVTVV